MDITGTWILDTWRRFDADGGVGYPFGEHPEGILIYAPDGHMAVQMMSTDRPAIPSQDPLGGSDAERAAAYSTCLAYFGRWEATDDAVTHHLEGSLFPNWARTAQRRPFAYENETLLLRVVGDDGAITNEIAWHRPKA